MNRILLTLFWTVLFTSAGYAQKNFTLSGYIRDASSGEELLYATVQVIENQTGTTTNLYGFYSLTLPEGKYHLVYSYLGYQTIEKPLNLESDQELTILLSPNAQVMEEIIVTAEAKDKNVSNNQMSVVELNMVEAKKIPVIFGEQDILKTIQLLPGVKGGGEGGSGFYVRGGNADQNLVLLDEAPVYSASHLLGFFSVFNSDALKDVKLYKGGMPAQYGGRASSVLDIRMKNGNAKKWTATGGLGLISSRLTVEGPIVKDKSSIIVSGRRTYADLLYKTVSNKIDDSQLYFYDLNIKANFTFSDKNRIYYSGYLGRDVVGTKEFGFDWGNNTNSLRWNHNFNQKMFLNTTLISSQYDYGINANFSKQNYDVNSGIYDYNLKQDYNYYVNPNNTITFGWNVINHYIKPGNLKITGELEVPVNVKLQKQNSLESGLYLANDQKINKRLSVYYGLRMSMFNNVGPQEVKTYDENGNVINTIKHEKNKFFNTYSGLEPRASATYVLSEKSSIKSAYNRNYQYLHQLTNYTSGSPTDSWITSSPNIKPITADQVSIGYFRNFNDNMFEFSVETYYKWLKNQLDYKEGANTVLNPDVEADLLYGTGRAYGAELLIRKNLGAFTGWIGYTLSKTERKIPGINNGNWYSARQDRTHDFSIVGTYQLSKKITVSGTWVYSTGDAVSFPTGKYNIDGVNLNLYSDRNGYRMPAYHRADLGLTWVRKDTKDRYSDLSFSIYNVYHRKNAYNITFEEVENSPGETQAVKTSLFGIIPSITWNFRY
ncbi:MAG: TonB-dependent receptor [Saprospiraceae bacterium]|nr:TonB-dependent receptor [Saprospiraceae bacterium]